MASGTKVKKHKCSCGRTFRHAISLKRHQNVTGCESAPEDASETEVPDANNEAQTAKVTRQTGTKATATRRPAAPVEDDRTIVITPELVAAWQEQTGFNRRPNRVVDTIPAKPQAPAIDWVGVANTGKEFYQFCGDVKRTAVAGTKSLLLVLSRAVLFCSVLTLAGWFLVTNVSASANSENDNTRRSQLAAQTVVQDFLQNAKLNQYQRARQLLAPGPRKSVSAEQLQLMFNSLPLNHTPTGWKTELSSDGRSAWVTVARDGVNEVYSLVHGDTGWGLASVSIANS
jgi:hypothetical protein